MTGLTTRRIELRNYEYIWRCLYTTERGLWIRDQSRINYGEIRGPRRGKKRRGPSYRSRGRFELLVHCAMMGDQEGKLIDTKGTYNKEMPVSAWLAVVVTEISCL